MYRMLFSSSATFIIGGDKTHLLFKEDFYISYGQNMIEALDSLEGIPEPFSDTATLIILN